MWIFGYGSLVWKADFPYEKKIIGYIKGYERKFWQASVDHRGSREKPGRVVTLVPSDDPECKVWGAAYLIYDKNAGLVTEQLDHREIMGYVKIPMTFYPVTNHRLNFASPTILLEVKDDKSLNNDVPFDVLTYNGSEGNEHFVGPAPIDSIASQIASCEGTSGSNLEYFLKLFEAMNEISEEAVDSHLRELDDAVRSLRNL